MNFTEFKNKVCPKFNKSCKIERLKVQSFLISCLKLQDRTVNTSKVRVLKVFFV